MIVYKLKSLMTDIIYYLTLLFMRDKVSTNVLDFMRTKPTRVHIICDNIHEWNSLVKSLKIIYPNKRMVEYFKAGKSILKRGRKPVIEIDEFGFCGYTSSVNGEEYNKSYTYYRKFKLYSYKELCIWKNN